MIMNKTITKTLAAATITMLMTTLPIAQGLPNMTVISVITTITVGSSNNNNSSSITAITTITRMTMTTTLTLVRIVQYNTVVTNGSKHNMYSNTDSCTSYNSYSTTDKNISSTTKLDNINHHDEMTILIANNTNNKSHNNKNAR